MPAVVFSGYNQRAIIAFLRTLSDCGVRYGIIALANDDSIFLTEYRGKVIMVRESKQLNFAEVRACLLASKKILQSQRLFVAPSSEALNRLLLHCRIELEEDGILVPLVDLKKYEQVSNKKSFVELCKSRSIDVPDEYGSIENAQIPFVAKPLHYRNCSGEIERPQLIQDAAEFDVFRSTKQVSNFFYQQLIQGQSYYILYYCYQDGHIEELLQINHVQQPDGMSIIAAETSPRDIKKITEQYKLLMRSIEFRGLIMIEVIERDNVFYMIEANPRFWGPSQLFIDAGVNLFECMLTDYGLIDNPRPHCSLAHHAKYFWYGGLAAVERERKKLKCYISESQFTHDTAAYHSIDIYNRPDTLELYRSEL